MNLRTRKLLRAGGSVAVGLPPDWLRYNKLEAGDEVEIVYDGKVLIRPKRREGEPNE